MLTLFRRPQLLHTQILIGLAVGAAAGVFSTSCGAMHPSSFGSSTMSLTIGQVFLRMLFMVVVPLVFTSLALGVATLGDISRIGRIGGKALGFFLATTALAASLGLLLMNFIRPGGSLDPAVRNALLAQYTSQAAEKVSMATENGFGINTFINIVPRNPLSAAVNGDMLALIFFTLIFGVALTKIPP